MSTEKDYKQLNEQFMKTKGRLPTESEKVQFDNIIKYATIGLMFIAFIFIFSLFTGSDDSPESIVKKHQEQKQEAIRSNAIEQIINNRVNVENNLNDPDSLKFKTEAMNLDNGAICYTYRARNGFGGVVPGVASIHNGMVYFDEKHFLELCPTNTLNYYFLTW